MQTQNYGLANYADPLPIIENNKMKKFLKIFLIFFVGNFVFAQNSNDGNIETSSKNL
jgi:hypothetical protein